MTDSYWTRPLEGWTLAAIFECVNGGASSLTLRGGWTGATSPKGCPLEAYNTIGPNVAAVVPEGWDNEKVQVPVGPAEVAGVRCFAKNEHPLLWVASKDGDYLEAVNVSLVSTMLGEAIDPAFIPRPPPIGKGSERTTSPLTWGTHCSKVLKGPGQHKVLAQFHRSFATGSGHSVGDLQP